MGSVSTNIENVKIPTMEFIIDKILRAYLLHGFHIVLLQVDIQFRAVKYYTNLDVQVNVVTRSEHVLEIERLIHVHNEHAHCYHAMLLVADINTIPCMMVMQQIIMVNFYVNSFVQIFSPLSIVEGIIVDLRKHFYVMESMCRQSREQQTPQN